MAINLTLSPEDKRWIKVYAAAHDTTVSEVLPGGGFQWVSSQAEAVGYVVAQAGGRIGPG